MSRISDQIALFGATKQHATGPDYDKEEHGMELLNKLNKTPKVTWGQKGSQNTLPSSRTSLEHNQFSDFVKTETS